MVPCYETAFHSLSMCSLPSYRQSINNKDKNVAFYLYNVLTIILTTCYTSDSRIATNVHSTHTVWSHTKRTYTFYTLLIVMVL